MAYNGLQELKGAGRGGPWGGLWNVEALSPSTRVSWLPFYILPPAQSQALVQKQEPKKGRGISNTQKFLLQYVGRKHSPTPQNKCTPK